MLPDQQHVWDWIEHACNACGHPEFIDEINLEWNRRFRARMGDASFKRKRIRLSVPLWPRADTAERRNTVIHEACHLLAFLIHGVKIKAHGKEWKSLMRKCGIEPDRTHNVNRTGLYRRQKRVVMYCACGLHMIAQRRATMVKKGTRTLTCRKCRRELTFHAQQIRKLG